MTDRGKSTSRREPPPGGSGVSSRDEHGRHCEGCMILGLVVERDRLREVLRTIEREWLVGYVPQGLRDLLASVNGSTEQEPS